MAAAIRGSVASHARPEGEAHITSFIFLSLALYNVMELTIITFTTFKRFRGLYCWSIIVSAYGTAVNAVGFILRGLDRGVSPFLYSSLVLFGWVAMITGQSLVLYSRLHIVLQKETRLRAVLHMIIFNAIFVSIPVMVLVYLVDTDPKRYVLIFSISEKVQLCIFFVQEAIISSLYLYETLKILKSHTGLAAGGNRQIMIHVVVINVVIILLDISVLALEFANLFNVQTAWKPFAYSIKLKMEFSVLNRLVELSQYVRRGRSISMDGTPSDLNNVETFEDGLRRGRNQLAMPFRSSQTETREIRVGIPPELHRLEHPRLQR